MTNKLTILNSFVMPAEDETFEVNVSDTKSLAPNCWLWNESVGYLEVVKYSLYNNIITVKNLGRRENAKRGTEFPTCMEFLITAPTALDPYNPLSTCLAADFNSPTVGQEAYMSVGSTYVIKVDDQIIVDSDYRYAVTQVVNATTLKVRNEGLGKEGIIEVGCGSCVPVQVVSKLNCCPIPSGDLTSNTSVLTVNNGYDVLLDNSSLTLDTDLSKYDNSTSDFITLNDVPRGTLSSSSTLIGVTGGSNNVLGNITLSLDTDLSKYDNTTSGFITLGDVPRGTLSSDSSLITVLGGVNNVLDNIELDLDTDLSKYDNTTSGFLASSDKKDLTSNTSVLTVTNGTGATLENTSLTLDTDLSKYDNTTSGFFNASDKKNLTSNTSVLTVTNGTGATLENTSLTLDTDLSQYDNTTSGFFSSVDKKNLTSNTPVLSVTNGTGATLENTSLTLNTDLSNYDNSVSKFISAGGLSSGDLSSSTPVLTVAGGTGALFTNATLTLDTDLSQYDNSVSGFITGISNLSDIGDVTITSPQDGDVLTYDSNSGEWINSTGGGGGSYLPLSGGTMTGNITISGSGFTLGNSTQEWNTVYTSQVTSNSNTLRVGGNSSSVFYFAPTATATTNVLGSSSTPWNEFNLSNEIIIGKSSSVIADNRIIISGYATTTPTIFANMGYYRGVLPDLTIVNGYAYYPDTSTNSLLGVNTQSWTYGFIDTVYSNKLNTDTICSDNYKAYTGNTLTVYNDIVPDTSGAYNLGSTSSGFKTLHCAHGNPFLVMGGSGQLRLYLDYDSNRTPPYALHTANNNVVGLGTSDIKWSIVYSQGGVSTSDIDQKENIEFIDSGLSIINKLPVCSFTWKNQEPDYISYGTIAQEVLKVAPELVEVPKGYKEGDGTLGLYTNNVLFLAVKAIQELSSKVDELNAKIKVLEGKL